MYMRTQREVHVCTKQVTFDKQKHTCIWSVLQISKRMLIYGPYTVLIYITNQQKNANTVLYRNDSFTTILNLNNFRRTHPPLPLRHSRQNQRRSSGFRWS